ncbi:hypothetical protein PCASD_22080 [Puccinia coronata f. sp. avenae]|uniref:Uncharacterized protein n=1 Tax=Puccinia coronata f. sp. avenae TaxID=200324 RepID=A0A2N5TYK8_9BASI|nr:hypothetical protein PCASD_22080 [Puccinia coronata f. sp. avenae]
MEEPRTDNRVGVNCQSANSPRWQGSPASPGVGTSASNDVNSRNSVINVGSLNERGPSGNHFYLANSIYPPTHQQTGIYTFHHLSPPTTRPATLYARPHGPISFLPVTYYGGTMPSLPQNLQLLWLFGPILELRYPVDPVYGTEMDNIMYGLQPMYHGRAFTTDDLPSTNWHGMNSQNRASSRGLLPFETNQSRPNLMKGIAFPSESRLDPAAEPYEPRKLREYPVPYINVEKMYENQGNEDYDPWVLDEEYTSYIKKIIESQRQTSLDEDPNILEKHIEAARLNWEKASTERSSDEKNSKKSQSDQAQEKMWKIGCGIQEEHSTGNPHSKTEQKTMTEIAHMIPHIVGIGSNNNKKAHEELCRKEKSFSTVGTSTNKSSLEELVKISNRKSEDLLRKNLALRITHNVQETEKQRK